MNPPILYICGPYTAKNGRTVAENIAIARTHAAAAVVKGWAPFTPHLNTAHFEEICTEIPHEGWLARDLAFLDLLDPAVDAMLLLPGWMESTGAMQEFQRARSRGIEIISPVASVEDIPPAAGRGICLYYREVHYETDDRDTCGYSGARCPPRKTCPIRRRCQ